MLRTVTIVMQTGRRTTVRALVRGVWALHRTPVDVSVRRAPGAPREHLRIVAGDGWTVTHVPTSLAAVPGYELPFAWRWFLRLVAEAPTFAADGTLRDDFPLRLKRELLNERDSRPPVVVGDNVYVAVVRTYRVDC